MTVRTTVMGAIVLTLCLSAAPNASARPEGSGVARRGVCSGPSLWKLRARPNDAAMLRVRFMISGGETDQTWNVYLDHNGTGFFAGSQISGVDGLVDVRSRTGDADGVDVIRATAHNIVSGETCRGRVRI